MSSWKSRRPTAVRDDPYCPAVRGGKVIKLQPDTEQYLLESIKRFFAEELDENIGDLKARTVLDYFVREIGPSVYNQAIADAQATLERNVADLTGTRYEPEFDFWKER